MFSISFSTILAHYLFSILLCHRSNSTVSVYFPSEPLLEQFLFSFFLHHHRSSFCFLSFWAIATAVSCLNLNQYYLLWDFICPQVKSIQNIQKPKTNHNKHNISPWYKYNIFALLQCVCEPTLSHQTVSIKFFHKCGPYMPTAVLIRVNSSVLSGPFRYRYKCAAGTFMPCRNSTFMPPNFFFFSI